MQVRQVKVCLVGSFAVGKTSLVRQFVDGQFDDRYLSTIGVKISRRVVPLPGASVKLLIWDLAGGDDVLRSNDNYLRGLSAALIVCDLTRSETLDVAVQYAQKVQAINADAALVLVGNKLDLVSARQIGALRLHEAAEEMGALACFETSAKTGDAVVAAFERVAEGVLG